VIGRGERIVPAVEGHDFRARLLGRPVGRIEEAVKRNRRGNVRTGSSDVERAFPTEAIAGDDQLPALDLAKAADLLDNRQKPAAKRHSIVAQPSHLAEHHVARGAPEFLAEKVGDEGIVAKLDQLLGEAQLKLGNAHHGRDQHDRRASLSIAATDEYALQFLAFELQRNRCLLAHSTSFASSASLATVFMLRAVPTTLAGKRSFDLPMPLG
jgi:hypothetical protein